jgi:uncharacterized protein (DUF2062 family)
LFGDLIIIRNGAKKKEISRLWCCKLISIVWVPYIISCCVCSVSYYVP